MSKIDQVTRKVAELIEPILEAMGFELVDVEYLSRHKKWVLLIYMDKDTGVTVNDCARVSGEIADLIDVKGIIEHEYTLEVSSPGLNRPLKKEKDFVWAIGKKIKMSVTVPQEGRRNFTGYLSDFQDQTLYLKTESGDVVLPWRNVAKANLVYEFEH